MQRSASAWLDSHGTVETRQRVDGKVVLRRGAQMTVRNGVEERGTDGWSCRWANLVENVSATLRNGEENESDPSEPTHAERRHILGVNFGRRRKAWRRTRGCG